MPIKIHIKNTTTSCYLLLYNKHGMEKAVPKEGDPIDEDEREINQGMYWHEENN